MGTPEPTEPKPLAVLGGIGEALRELAQEQRRIGRSLRHINLRNTVTGVINVAVVVMLVWAIIAFHGVLGTIQDQSHSNGEGVTAAKQTLAAIEDCLTPHGRCARLAERQRAADRRKLIGDICRLFTPNPTAVSECVARAVAEPKAAP